MKRIAAALTATLFCSLPLLAIDIHDTRMLTQPAISADHVAFVYGGDVWLANVDGSDARKVTSHPGTESNVRISPDGKLIAFSGQYQGNTDVYVVGVDGGVPRRLTWHPGADLVLGFTPDSSSVLFSSGRSAYTSRHLQFYTVPAGGGMETKLPIPYGVKAAFSSDGKTIAYVPQREAFTEWKHYRGGTASWIWLFDVATYAVEKVPQPEARCNDTDPMWIGSKLYFRSDRNGEFNLFSYDRGTKKVEQLTTHNDFPVLNAAAGGNRIVYEQAGYLHTFDAQSRATKRLKIGVAADLVETQPRFAKGAKWVRDLSLSPSGARAVMEYRGEIVTVPAEKGDDRNLTNTPGAHERAPAWSPDGRSIAWFSDVSGENALYIAPQSGNAPPRMIAIDGAGYYANPRWSPDSKRLSFIDNAYTLFVLDVDSGSATRVAQHVVYGPGLSLDHSWSPDSKWLAYTINTKTYYEKLNLYSIAEKKSYAVTEGLSDVTEPVFDAGGKYLYFFASTDAGPADDWFSQSNADIRATRSIYFAVLPKGLVSPLAKESDEETGAAAKEESKSDSKAPVNVVVDLDGLTQRIQALPLPAADYINLRAGVEGNIYYLRRDGGPSEGDAPPNASLQHFDLKKKKEETLLAAVQAFELSADRKKILLRQNDTTYTVTALGDKIDTTKGQLALDRVQVRVDPPSEWREIFEDAWRINRDYFYDPKMHGTDWPAIRRKYEPFLADLSSRDDLTRLLQWMGSELSVGHHRVSGGDSAFDTPSIPGGLLGADYEVANGRYRFAKVYGGLNWNPDLRAPLTEPGVGVKPGEYLIAVDGKDLKPPENLYGRFEQTSGRIVEITVGPDPSGAGARTVKVVPIANEQQLRNRDWVEGNLRKVTEATNGRVAYVYVPNTANLGHTYFKRYFFPQADRDAIIVDERHNGGGQVADYYIDILRRPLISYWAMRYGADLRTPLASIQGPKVMLIDETAGSGGDLLPWMFRKLKLGPLVGKRTWGGLVGILGFPELMDGGTITAPNIGIWTEEGFIVENEGVPPDIEVEQLPALLIAGRDPQLEKAIEVALQQLRDNPVVTPKRPSFPVRVQR
jgi:tricorn protease